MTIFATVSLAKHSHKSNSHYDDDDEDYDMVDVRDSADKIDAANYLSGFVKGLYNEEVGDYS